MAGIVLLTRKCLVGLTTLFQLMQGQPLVVYFLECTAKGFDNENLGRCKAAQRCQMMVGK